MGDVRFDADVFIGYGDDEKAGSMLLLQHEDDAQDGLRYTVVYIEPDYPDYQRNTVYVTDCEAWNDFHGGVQFGRPFAPDRPADHVRAMLADGYEALSDQQDLIRIIAAKLFGADENDVSTDYSDMPVPED
jgi:hypothetical protein